MRTIEDFIQEALIIIYEKYRDIEFEKGILPWAYGVLDRVMNGDYRTTTRRQNILAENRNEVVKIHQAHYSAEDEVTTSELSAEVWRALNQLSSKEKEIFRLKMEGYSGEEIQRKLGISRTALDVTVFRGRKKLREKLEKRGAI